MRPSEMAIEKVKSVNPIFRENIENIITDFQDFIGPDVTLGKNHVDLSFVSFAAGMTVPMDPKSHFNRDYVVLEVEL